MTAILNTTGNYLRRIKCDKLKAKPDFDYRHSCLLDGGKIVSAGRFTFANSSRTPHAFADIFSRVRSYIFVYRVDFGNARHGARAAG